MTNGEARNWARPIYQERIIGVVENLSGRTAHRIQIKEHMVP